MDHVAQLQRTLDHTSLRTDALNRLASVLSDLGTDEAPEDGSYTYANEFGRAERFLLGGGGPTIWAVFVEFGEEVLGVLEYTDSEGVTSVHIPTISAAALRASLRRDSKARLAR